MRVVNVGIVGVGNVGGGALEILGREREALERKLGFPLRVRAVASRSIAQKTLPEGLGDVQRSADWREVAGHPEVDIVAELIGGTGVAREVIETAIASGKHVVTANKELIAQAGPEIWAQAARRGVRLAMEASVCGGIPIHGVLREGIAGDSIEALFGILNGTSNYILTEIEKHGSRFEDVLKEAQRLGYAEADPAADIEGYDARSKLALLASLAFGVRIRPESIATEGIGRVTPEDFDYARQLGCTIRLLCAARRTAEGYFLSVRPALIPSETIIAGVQGAYNAVWVRGRYGADTFYYGRGAGPLPTGVAVVSDLARLAREMRCGEGLRVSPFGFEELAAAEPLPIGRQKRPWYLRFRVKDRPGIIAALSAILAAHHISLDAIFQLPHENKQNLPFVITVETTTEDAIREALRQMAGYEFMVEAPLALQMEAGL